MYDARGETASGIFYDICYNGFRLIKNDVVAIVLLRIPN